MAATPPEPSVPQAPQRRRYVGAVGPRLQIVLSVVFALSAAVGANSAYLLSVSLLGWWKGQTFENWFYLWMVLAHVVLGLLLIVPFIVFAIGHVRNARNRPNRRAVRVGYVLVLVSVVVLVSGLTLTRVQIGSLSLIVKSPVVRSANYWLHVLSPIAVIWLYVLHRLAGPRIKWEMAAKWAVAVAAVIAATVVFHSQDPRRWNVAGPTEGSKYFAPSLARTSTGRFIPAKTLMMDQYCMNCHKDTYNDWFHSAHHFSSFNNPAYLFSVRETRDVLLKRVGNAHAVRWCGGCHDPVPFLSGAFDNPYFDDVKDPTSQAGITCTTCHAITHINSTVGNADYTIEEPINYPFAQSNNALLQWVNQQLVKAKPEFHKMAFLKPLHKSAEFCSTCHKVGLPKELNGYKDFLRGQNHYDTYLLSGVSGHGARSFYYPEHAQQNCNGCHMPSQSSDDFGAKYLDLARPGVLMVHNHLFPGGNTGIAAIRNDEKAVSDEQAFLRDIVRVDIFGLKDGGTVDGVLSAPLRPAVPKLVPGKTYLIEIAIRTLKLGHPFTQGTADSNEVWLDVSAARAADGLVIGRSGGRDAEGRVDPWSHFVNVYMLDRDGNRIDRRNPQDIFTPLYDHQIPPGASRVVHYSFTVPADLAGPVTLETKLQYRKFDTTYMKLVLGPGYKNDLPVTTLASDHIVFNVAAAPTRATLLQKSGVAAWERWNDYGIGLLLEEEKGGEKGELLQAEQAFDEVERLNRFDGPINLARVYYKEGRLNEAVMALQRAGSFDPPAPKWTVAWLSGLVNKQNGSPDAAIADFKSVLEDRYPHLDRRGFDFSTDYEVINELAQSYLERSKMERGDGVSAQRDDLLREAAATYERTLKIDSENVAAHYGLSLIYGLLGNAGRSAEHRAAHDRSRPDDNARDRAIRIARQNSPAADHAAQSIVIYSLQRDGAFELPPEASLKPASAARR